MSMNDYWLEGRGERAETGVLLIHGLTGTPNEMRILARGLNNAGFTVYAVQLAGHCGTLNDLLESTWQEWLASVRAGADKLMVKVKKLIVGGLSMGAVLALALATERPQQIAGVMALSSTFRHDGWSMPKYTRLAFILPYLRMLGIGRQKCFTRSHLTVLKIRHFASVWSRRCMRVIVLRRDYPAIHSGL